VAVLWLALSLAGGRELAAVVLAADTLRRPKTGKIFSALPACNFVIACLPICLLAYSLDFNGP
jgi:hypothetical protein